MDVSDLARHGARDVVIESLSRARLELPHDRHAGGARPLPARAARRDPRRARRGSPSATPRRSSGSRTSSRRTSPSTRSAPGSPTRCGSPPDAPVERNELMRRLLHDGVPTRRGVMAIHEEPAYAGADAVAAAHRGGHARLADAAALRGPDRRAAGPRDRPPRDARGRPGGVSPEPLLIVGGGGFARETLELVHANRGARLARRRDPRRRPRRAGARRHGRRGDRAGRGRARATRRRRSRSAWPRPADPRGRLALVGAARARPGALRDADPPDRGRPALGDDRRRARSCTPTVVLTADVTLGRTSP